MLQQVISVALLAAMATIPPAASQGIQGTISGNVRTGPPPIRVFVATPYPSSPGDSTAAVTIGNNLRNKLSGSLGSDWAVVTRPEMNKYLISWGYGADQLFAPESARQMVTAMIAKMFVMTTMTKGSDGKFTASVRVTGSSDEAGQVFRATQLPNQSLADFANKLGDQVTVIFKAYPDAKQCSDNLTANKQKALEGAAKAIKAVPSYGYPEYCLGLIEQAKDSTGPETVRHFRASVAGDPFSIKAVNQLAIIDQKKKDTVAVVSDYTQMLTIAPTNRGLADEAYKVFKQWGHPEAADSLADAQIKINPSSPDWPDLKGNSCMIAASSNPDQAKAKDKYKCAYDAFVHVIELDPTRADTDFFPKIVFVAGNRADSMTWIKKWADKYQSTPDPYKAELQMYMDAGQVDSALAVAKVLGALDPTDAKPLLAIESSMLKAHRYDDVFKLAPMFPKGADDNSRNLFAGLLVQEGQNIIADTANKTEAKDSTLARMGHVIVAFHPSNAVYGEMGNYLIAASYTTSLTRLSVAAGADKSCETVTKYEALLDAMDAEPAIKALTTATTPSLVAYSNSLIGTIQSEKTNPQRLPAMKKAYCKP